MMHPEGVPQYPVRQLLGHPFRVHPVTVPPSGGIRFAQTPRLLSGDAFSVMKHKPELLLIYSLLVDKFCRYEQTSWFAHTFLSH